MTMSSALLCGAVARVVAERALLAALAVAVDADDLAVEPGRAVAAARVGTMPGRS